MSTEDAMALGYVLWPVLHAIPPEARERLAAGEDPQQLADETMGRLLRLLGAPPGRP